jgi:hypothetical protein
MQQRQMSALALSPIKREIADSVVRANRPEGNYQCRRWYDLFAATPEAHSVCARLLHEATFNFVPRSDESAIELSSMRARIAPVLCSDAVNAM